MGTLTKMVLVGVGRAAVGQVRPKYQADPGPRRWHSRKRHERASAWWTLAALLVASLYGMVVDPPAVVANWRAVAVLAAGWLVAAWIHRERKASVRRRYYLPLGAALSSYFKSSQYSTSPDQWMRLPYDPRDQASTIYVPQDWSPTETAEKNLVRLVGRKCGLNHPSYDINLEGQQPYVKVWPAPAPRETVLFSDPEVRAMVDAAPEGHPLFGLAPRDEPCNLDFDAAVPHLGFSIPTTGGKSSSARPVMMKHLRDGGIVMVLDRKIGSQQWCDGLPGVHYARTEQEIHDALMWLSGEIDRRFALVREHCDINGDVEPEVIGPRLLVVVEELNTLEMDLGAWWRERRESGQPLKSPALNVLGRALAMGRAGRVHLLVIAQKLTAQSIGGTAARENLSTRVLARATQSTWNMLAPECKVGGKYPRSSRVIGRVYVVFGDEATPVQIVWVTPQEAREYAQAGMQTPFPPVREVGSAAVLPGETQVAEVPHLSLVVDEEEDLVTMAEFSEQTGIKVKAMDNARFRGLLPEPVFRAPGRPSCYRRSDLELWAEARAVGVGGEAL